MGDEKLPKDYSPGVIQKILERLKMTVTTSDKKRAKELYDSSVELKQQVDKLEKKLTQKIDTLGGERTPVHASLPVPKDLVAHELGIFGLTSVDPFFKWKYIGKIQGYEFYGSPNSGFSPKVGTYSQSGVHRGGDASDFLYTADVATPENTFYFDNRIVGLVIKNITTGEEGTVDSLDLWEPLVKIYAKKDDTSYLTWDADDVFKIKSYPSNKLFSIDAFCLFLKPLIIPFYVKARTTGKGNSFSAFTGQVSTQAPEIVLEKPIILAPRCKTHMLPPSEERCTMTDDGKPYCSYHGRALEWDEVFDGSMEVAHYSRFGVEWCEVELWMEVEDVFGMWLDFAQGSSLDEINLE